MYSKYYREYSNILERKMEFMIYGHNGKPCIAFPAQDGRFYDFFNFGMIDSAKELIEEGKIQIFCVDSIDWESWTFTGGDYNERIMQHEKWYAYIIDELIPRIREINEESSGKYFKGKLLTVGCSMGAFHGLNFFLRRPDIFDSTIALSGLYSAEHFFPHYNNENIYLNSPIDYMKNISDNHEYVDMYKKSKIILCCGQGRWEEKCLRDTIEMEKNFKRIKVPAWIDLWGCDVDHDWPWWKIQFPYFLDKIF